MSFEISFVENSLSVKRDGVPLFESFGAELDDGYRVISVKLENELRLYIDAKSDHPMTSLKFPSAVEPKPDDILLIPHFEGFMLRADDTTLPLPGALAPNGGAIPLSMSFWGILRAGCFLLCAIYTNFDSRLILERENGLLAPRVEWMSEKGQFGYRRELCYIVGEGGISELCDAYRRIADEKGYRKRLSEREKQLPAISRLIGAADVWLWNDDAMEKLYSENAVYHAPTAAQNAERVRIAREMKTCGMEHILWSVFDECIDIKTVETIKSLGFLTTFYDIYTDVIPHELEQLIPDTRRERCKPRRECYPDGIIIDKSGKHAKAWQLKGKDGVFYDQERICDAAAVECAGRVIPEHTKKYGLEGRFLDVQAQPGSACECYDERHPMTRRSSFDYKRRMFEIFHESGLIAGTEIGCEDAAAYFEYNEGMLSPTFARQYDAGRRMTHIYTGDAVEPCIRDFMLNPRYRVPLWELIYHGCVQSYWYWGDSASSTPELILLRDKFCRLWGLPEIYSFKVSDWERLKDVIVGSYKRTTPLARSLGRAEMLRFDILDDEGLIQRTTFSDGTCITEDFREK